MARARKSMSALAFLRKALLVYVLIMVALGAWLARSRSTDWADALRVTVYPVNADGSEQSQTYIDALTVAHFDDVEAFIQREGARFGMTLPDAIRIELAEQVAELPPTPPASRSVPAVMLWSLKLRYYAWQKQRNDGLPAPDVRLFLLYFNTEDHTTLAHSLGLKEGLIGVVNGYASRRETTRNHVVLVHELLHTLGATDKYDLATNQPLYPDGYAEPDKTPRHPQTLAEIMGGRVPLNDAEAVMPDSLRQTVVGPATAREIGWTAP